MVATIHCCMFLIICVTEISHKALLIVVYLIYWSKYIFWSGTVQVSIGKLLQF